jgi:hypothetical protein
MGDRRKTPQWAVAQVAELAGPQGVGCVVVMRWKKMS